ncbi:MAG TPA: EamA family transporter [Flavitalea sp.]|nr:EamA family transporter [Flavitalea sp.]
MQVIQRLYPSFIRNRGTRFKAFIALGLVSFFWGTTWIASKEGVRHMPALQLAGLRQLAGGILYLIFFMSKGRVWPRGKEWRSIIILSFLNFMLSNALSTWGVKYISAGLGSIIGATFPLWMVLIGLISNKKSIPTTAILGFLLGFAGICVIFYEHLYDFLNTSFLFGIILSLAATWSWAFGTIYTKKHAKSFNPYFSFGLQMIISGTVILLVCQPTNLSIPLKNIPWQSWAAIAYLVIFSSVISFIAYLYALQHLSAEQTSVYAYINPVVAVSFGALLFGEKLTAFIAIGGIITLLGVYLINRALRNHRNKEIVI